MHAFVHQRIGGIALQLTDQHRLALGGFAHANFFAQGFCRADPRAHPAQNVLRQDRLCGGFGRACGDLADEQRDVDVGGAGCGAGGVMAKIAAISGHKCLVVFKTWM